MIAPSLLDQVGIQNWPAFVLVSARVAGLFMVEPLWAITAVPRTVRGAMAVVFSVALLPTLTAAPRLPDDMIAMSLLLGGETLLGMAMGMLGALVLQGVVIAGDVASLQMGLSLGQALGSLPEGTTVGVGQLQGYFALSIYLMLGGHLTLYQGLATSFATIPPGHALLGLGGSRAVVDLAETIFQGGIQAAAPVLIALLLAHVALAILGKAVPQLNVMMVSFPVTIAIGLVALGTSLPFLGAYLSGTVAALPDQAANLIAAFGAAAAVR
ncbi:MAG TPA: flagellar biosynthetic protein FliR [Gemmatimonadales bacterium]|nr:flagellar biosynthetic protein FliR [Gemmatimonadales bacterium]